VLASHAFSFVVSHSRDKHAANRNTALLAGSRAGGAQQRVLEGGGKRGGRGGLGDEARYEMVPVTSDADEEFDKEMESARADLESVSSGPDCGMSRTGNSM